LKLKTGWGQDSSVDDNRSNLCDSLLAPGVLAGLDLFDRLQLESVLEICRTCSSMAEAGRRLFGNSMRNKQSSNDSDRLRKYLQRFGISWKSIVNAASPV